LAGDANPFPPAFGACLVSLTGYLIAIGFFVCAVAKPFYPDRDGLWWDARNHTLVGLGFIWPGPPDQELLGWWIIPLGLFIFVFLFFSTTRFARWNIGRIKLDVLCGLRGVRQSPRSCKL
jgi:hypothetical protein